MMTKEEAMIRTLAKENDELEMEIGRLRQSLEKESCEDAVSKKSLLARLRLNYSNNQNVSLPSLIDIVNTEPSVTPARKHGEWERETFDLGANLPVRVAYQCSECGNYFDSEFNFCPHCGADMRGSEGRE